MEQRLPSHEELVDLAWLLDSALMVDHRDRAIDSGSRLLEALLRHEDGMAGGRPEAAATTAASGAPPSLLPGDVASVLTSLRRGDTPRRVEFRHRVQALAGADDNLI